MDPLFQTHQLNGAGMDKARDIAEAFDTFLTGLKALCSVNTREFSIVKTKLEEACFFAKKSMASQPENQQV